MNIDLNDTDIKLMKMLLNKELGDTRVEVHHAENPQYKKLLKDREAEVRSMLSKINRDNISTGE